MNKNKLTKLKLALQKLLVEYTALTTDKGILYFEEDNIKTDIQVYLEDENGDKQVAESGVYETETQTITVANGRITGIIEKTNNEPMTEETNKKKEAFEAQKMNFEATYQEIQRNIYNALDKAHIYCYIVENTNEYVIVSVWDEAEGTDKLFKYNITVDEDGKVTLGEGYEVKIEYVAKMEEQTPAPTPVEEPVPAPVEEPNPAPVEEPADPQPAPDPQPVEEPTEPQPQANTVNFEDLIAKARQQEKAKLYPQIQKLQEQNNALTEKNNAHLLTIGEKDARISELEKQLAESNNASKKGASEKEASLLSKIAELEKELTDIKANTVSREEIEAEIKAEYDVKLYREQKLREVGDTVIPELITGTTIEEIDASIKVSQERYNQITSKFLGGVQVPVANVNTTSF